MADASGKSDAGRSPRWRTIVPWVLVVVASLLIVVSSLTIWTKRQLLEPDNWADTSSKLLENEQVRNAIAVYLVNELYSKVDVPAELEQELPAQAKPLAAPLAAALQNFAVRTTEAFLARPATQRLWRPRTAWRSRSSSPSSTVAVSACRRRTARSYST